ncbi:MAG: hypothetical protein IPQ05_15655 [Leptospiraceae bacterium]|nr:hypothetical protein [Leptospiraceae bacterium]
MNFRLLSCALLLLACISILDCATYWNNRRKDLQDVITVGVEKPAYGVTLKLAPLNLGFLFVGGETEPGKKDLGGGIGLRGGSFSSYVAQQLVFGWMGGDTFYSGELELADDGKMQYEKKIPIVKNARDNIKSYSVTYFKIFSDPPKDRKKRQKEEVRSVVIKKMLEDNPNADPALLAYLPKENLKPNGYPKSYLYQIEFAIGIYGGLRVGFNPAELIDFILGFTTYDLYDDDVKD